MALGDPGEMCASPRDAVAAMIACLPASNAVPAIESCPLVRALGRILAEPARADRDSPAFDQSSMDGYAVRAETVRAMHSPGGVLELPVVGECRIGAAPPSGSTLPAALRIATGAPLPVGPEPADAILKREEVEEVWAGATGPPSDPPRTIRVPTALARELRPGRFVRRRGENCLAGHRVVEAGAVLTPAAIGLLASIGVASPRVRACLGVWIITTGDEVAPPDASPAPYEIRNASAPALAALIDATGWARVVGCRHAPDDPDQVLTLLRHALDQSDAVVLTAGVSMGHRDPVRAAIERAGGRIAFHGVRQRPGKPMLGGVAPGAGGRTVPVLGLPGNPVSSLVTCVRVVLPVLAHAAGAGALPAPPAVRLRNPDDQTLDLWWHRPVHMLDNGEAALLPTRGSGDLASIASSDGFVELPPGHAGRGVGLAFYPWRA